MYIFKLKLKKKKKKKSGKICIELDIANVEFHL